MSLPVKHEDGAEGKLGTASLELTRVRARQFIAARQDITPKVRKRIFAELDELIESERRRRGRLAVNQIQREELEHRVFIARRSAEVFCELRALRTKTDNEATKYACDNMHMKLDVVERLLRLREKYRATPKKDDYMDEIEKMHRKRLLAEAHEKAILRSITDRALRRAAFVKQVRDEFPDMAEELIDYYDQQVFQQGMRG